MTNTEPSAALRPMPASLTERSVSVTFDGPATPPFSVSFTATFDSGVDPANDVAWSSTASIT